MFTAAIFLAVCFLAWSNGANDNFKGVASLYGSRTCGYRAAVSWATAATLAGSVTALFLAQILLKRFSGKGLVPDALASSPEFILAVAIGAGATVILATLLGFPISTTHGLMGALVGAGVVGAGSEVNIALLGTVFMMPLLLSPLLAIGVAGAVYLSGHCLRLRLGVTSETCVCAGVEQEIIPLAQSNGMSAAQSAPRISVVMDQQMACSQRYSGAVFGMNAGWLLDRLHFLSAGTVSFARGLNDTPKIAALLLAAAAFDIRWSLFAVAAAIAMGGLLHARKVADTMSHRITGMNPGQGFAANISTAVLVTTASIHGQPVSTTHVSVGSLVGMGIVTGQAKWKPVLGVLAAWMVTVPCAAVLAGLAYWLAGLSG